MVHGQEDLSDKDDTEAKMQVGGGERGLGWCFSWEQQLALPKISETDPVLHRGKLESEQWTKD